MLFVDPFNIRGVWCLHCALHKVYFSCWWQKEHVAYNLLCHQLIGTIKRRDLFCRCVFDDRVENESSEMSRENRNAFANISNMKWGWNWNWYKCYKLQCVSNVCKHSRRISHKYHFLLFPTVSQMNLQSHPMMKSCRWEAFNSNAKRMLFRSCKGRAAIGGGSEAVRDGKKSEKWLKNRDALSVNDSKSSFLPRPHITNSNKQQLKQKMQCFQKNQKQMEIHTTNKQSCASGWIAIMLSKWNGQVEWSANYV